MELIASVLVFAVAAQTTVVLSNDAEEAKRACTWDNYSGKWSCERTRLEHFRLIGRAQQDGTTTAVVKAAPVSDGTCLRAVAVSISDQPGELVVDWSRVVFSVDGTATQAAPSFARRITSSLSQRPSVAPVGTVLREEVFSVDVDCVGMKRPPYNGVSTLELHLPHTIGGEAATFVWRMEREWVAVPEADVFALIPAPERNGEPGMRPPVTVCCALWGPGAWLAAVALLVPAAIAGEVAYWQIIMRGDTSNSGVIAGMAACAACLCLGPVFWAVIGGLFTDVVWAIVSIAKRSSASAREAEQRKYAAWENRRAELGLE